MPSRDKVLVKLDRADAERLKRWAYDKSRAPYADGFHPRLFAALDSNQHEQVEEEYRVFHRKSGRVLIGPEFLTSRKMAEEAVASYRHGAWPSAYVQTFADGEWVDLDETGEGS